MIEVAVWLPTATTNDAGNIGATYAVFYGEGEGGDHQLDKWGFDWGLTDAYGESHEEDMLIYEWFYGFSIAFPIGTFQPDTTYHFRAKVRDTAGNWAYGDDKEFHTLATPLAWLYGYVYDIDGNPVPYPVVMLDGTQAGSSPTGHYSFGEVEPGTYTLTCEMEGYAPFSETITLNPGDNIQRFIVLGMVTGKANVFGSIVDTVGNTIPAVTIVLNGVTTATTMIGTFTITNLEPGPYTITCTKAGWQDFTKDVTLKEGDNTIDIEMLAEGEEEPPSWWDKHWKKVAIISGASAAVAGGVALARRR